MAINASKKAIQLAKTHGVDLEKVTGTGANGQITVSDVSKARGSAPSSNEGAKAGTAVATATANTASPENTAQATSRGRDPERSHFNSYAPLIPVRDWPKDGTKTRLCFDMLLTKTDGVTIADLSEVLKGFGPTSKADLPYSRTWAAKSYLQPYGMGIIARHDPDGLVRLYGVRVDKEGVASWNSALSNTDRAAITLPAVKKAA